MHSFKRKHSISQQARRLRQHVCTASVVLVYSLVSLLVTETHAHSQSTKPLAVWIDTDPSCGNGFTQDVDDCLALLQALHSPELDIVGVGTVFGNADHATTASIARDVVQQFGCTQVRELCRSLVHTGASNLDHGFIKTQVTQALASLLKDRQLTILALGPLTNVATLIVHHPELRSQIKEVIAVAGRRPGQRFQPNIARPITLADRNFEEDPISFDIVLHSGIPLTLTPYEVASKVTVNQHDLETLGAGTKASRWISHKARAWSRLWRWVLGTEGFYPFDTLAVGYLTAAQQFQCEVLPARIKATRHWLFQTHRTLEVSKRFVGSPEVTYCYDVAPEFKDDMMARLLVDAG